MFSVADQNQKIHWIEVKIECDGELAEALTEVLGRFVSNGVVVESVTRFNPRTQENEPTGQLHVAGYLAVDDELEHKRQKLAEALWHLGQISPIPEPTYQPILDENWMEAWKKHYRPITIGKKILIVPAWYSGKRKGDRAVIRINPAMAFGTGTHPTTQLCLEMIERHLTQGIKLIDVGCGSGTLSIAALKLGASHVLAVDTDSQAVTSTLENAELNSIAASSLEVGRGSIEEIHAGRYSLQQAPLVLVNILASIILRLFDQGLSNLVSDDGVLLLSGILEDQADEIIQKGLAHGMKVIDQCTQGDWVSLALSKEV